MLPEQLSSNVSLGKLCNVVIVCQSEGKLHNAYFVVSVVVLKRLFVKPEHKVQCLAWTKDENVVGLCLNVLA